MYVRGLDASSIQGLLPIKALDDLGCKFLISKATQGNEHGIDPYFERNIQAAKDMAWYVGKYDFIYPLKHIDPKVQAEAFFEASNLGAELGDIPPVLDLEWPEPSLGWKKWGCSAPQVSDFTRICAERSTELYGRKPILYSYTWFLKVLADGADISWMSEYSLWLPAEGSRGRVPTDTDHPVVIPKPWTDFAFWQHDWDGGMKLPNGIDADFDVYNGSIDDLKAFCGTHPHDTPFPELTCASPDESQ